LPTTFIVYTHEDMGEFHAIHDYKTPKEMGKGGCGNPFISKIN
jgi:hypothetical protein